MFGFGSKNLLGVDIGSSTIKIAELESSRKGYELSSFGVMPLARGVINSGEIIDPVNVGQSIKSLAASMKSKRNLVVSGLFGSAVIVKKISMPKMDTKLVAEQIKWEAEQYIPFDINDVTIEYKILKSAGSSETMDILLVAAKQDLVFRYIEAIEAAQLKLESLDINGFGLANCFEFNYGVQQGVVGLLNFGAASTNFVVIDKGDVIYCRDILIGGFNYTNDIMQTMNISFEESEALKISASMGQEVPTEVNTQIMSTNEHYVEEVKSSLEFFNAASGNLSVSRFYVTGGGIFVPGLVASVSKSTNIPYEVLDPFLKISFNKKNLSPEYIEQIRPMSAIAIGLGLRKVGDVD